MAKLALKNGDVLHAKLVEQQGEVLEVGYQMKRDGELYKHEYGDGAQLWLARINGRHAVVIIAVDDTPLWGLE